MGASTVVEYRCLFVLQLIELWETFLMQLDADEDGEPFFKPPAVAQSTIQQQPDRKLVNEEQAEQQAGPDQASAQGQPHEAAAASATIEAE